MKKLIFAVILLYAAATLFAAFDAAYSDRLFYNENDYEKDFAYLEKCLGEAKTDSEKAEILWRMSRTKLTIVDENKDSMSQEERYKGYGDYGANDKPKADDTSSAYYYAYRSLSLKETAEGYHWESSAVGRAGQEHGPLNSLGKAGPMRKLETKAIEEFDNFPLETDAWYVLGILYDALPGKPISFGDNNTAISCMKKCLMTQDMVNRTNGTNYLDLAEMLWKRNWDAKKRAKEFESMLKSYKKNASKGKCEMNKDFEGYMASQGAPFYVAAELTTISDRQEAVALLQYGIAVIDSRIGSASATARSKMEKERAKLEAKLQEWQYPPTFPHNRYKVTC